MENEHLIKLIKVSIWDKNFSLIKTHQLINNQAATSSKSYSSTAALTWIKVEAEEEWEQVIYAEGNPFSTFVYSLMKK